ncbi:MAG: hypothetical protein OEV66_10925 [Spirochaetia bacterium]|nr:hypothetical protein [Spirochaetia bacterium]
MKKDIEGIMTALENNQIQVVNEFLKSKWQQDVNSFIQTVTDMRNYNASLADRLLNSREFVMQFSRR